MEKIGGRFGEGVIVDNDFNVLPNCVGETILVSLVAAGEIEPLDSPLDRVIEEVSQNNLPGRTFSVIYIETGRVEIELIVVIKRDIQRRKRIVERKAEQPDYSRWIHRGHEFPEKRPCLVVLELAGKWCSISSTAMLREKIVEPLQSLLGVVVLVEMKIPLLVEPVDIGIDITFVINFSGLLDIIEDHGRALIGGFDSERYSPHGEITRKRSRRYPVLPKLVEDYLPPAFSTGKNRVQHCAPRVFFADDDNDIAVIGQGISDKHQPSILVDYEWSRADQAGVVVGDYGEQFDIVLIGIEPRFQPFESQERIVGPAVSQSGIPFRFKRFKIAKVGDYLNIQSANLFRDEDFDADLPGRLKSDPLQQVNCPGYSHLEPEHSRIRSHPDPSQLEQIIASLIKPLDRGNRSVESAF